MVRTRMPRWQNLCFLPSINKKTVNNKLSFLAQDPVSHANFIFFFSLPSQLQAFIYSMKYKKLSFSASYPFHYNQKSAIIFELVTTHNALGISALITCVSDICKPSRVCYSPWRPQKSSSFCWLLLNCHYTVKNPTNC